MMDRAADTLRGSIFIGIFSKKYAAPLDLPPAGRYRIKAEAVEKGGA